MKSELLTPVLLNFEDQQYKLIYLKFSHDGSIYLMFPNKSGYKIKARKDIPPDISGEISLVLDNITETYFLPKISFHPAKNIIHINCLGNKYEYDKPVLNMSASVDALLFPLCQVVFPNDLTLYDSYKTKRGHNIPLIFNVRGKFSVSLSLEIWIHNIGYYIDLNDVPLINKRGKVIGAFRFNNHNLNKYTCTIIASEIKETGRGIIVANYNAVQPFVFELTV